MFGFTPFDAEEIAKTITAFNNGESDYLIKQLTSAFDDGSHTSLIINGMKIAGVTEGGDGTLFVDNDSFTAFVTDDITVRKVLVKTGGSTLKNINLLNIRI